MLMYHIQHPDIVCCYDNDWLYNVYSPQNLHNFVFAQLLCKNLDAAVGQMIHTQSAGEHFY